MRVMITGARGLLGLNLALMAAEAHTVIGVDKLDILQPETFSIIKADLLEDDSVPRALDEGRPDWVIHCAALANVDACEKQPELAQRLNVDLPAKLAAETAKRGIRLVHISTDAVFDGQTGGYTEEDPVNPLSVYAQNKVDSERAVAQANPEAVIARVNFFGWSYSGRRSLAEFFFNNLRDGNPIKGFHDVYFCSLFVGHLGAALLEMLEKGLSGMYHTVSSESLSKYEFGVRLAHRFGFDPDLIAPISVNDFGLTAARSPNLTLSTEKLAIALGHPLPGIEAGLEQFHKLYQQGYPGKLKQLAKD